MTSQVTPSEELFFCEVCKEPFKAKHYLNSHMLYKHNANISSTRRKENSEDTSKPSLLGLVETSEKPQSAKKEEEVTNENHN